MGTITNLILCTGNPADATVASAVAQRFAHADFASRATGYDFKTWANQTEDKFRKTIVNYNTFINSSYICSGAQLKLLELTWKEWMRADIKGHIITIGTTAEWTDNEKYSEYIASKRELRSRSLQLNDETGISGVKTSYIIVGGVNDGKPDNEQYVSLYSIAYTIESILNNPDRIPLLQLESAK